MRDPGFLLLCLPLELYSALLVACSMLREPVLLQLRLPCFCPLTFTAGFPFVLCCNDDARVRAHDFVQCPPGRGFFAAVQDAGLQIGVRLHGKKWLFGIFGLQFLLKHLCHLWTPVSKERAFMEKNGWIGN